MENVSQCFLLQTSKKLLTKKIEIVKYRKAEIHNKVLNAKERSSNILFIISIYQSQKTKTS